jgi:hypothetical protein
MGTQPGAAHAWTRAELETLRAEQAALALYASNLEQGLARLGVAPGGLAR